MAAFLLTSPGNPFEDLTREHGGSIAASLGDSSVLLFDLSHKAIECALAIQARLPEKRLLLRMSVHVNSDKAHVSEEEMKAASILLEATPAGRVFLTRQAYSQAQGARVCAFIPLGLEYFTGLAEPLEIYEAIQTRDQPRRPAPLRTTATSTAPVPLRPLRTDPGTAPTTSSSPEDQLVEMTPSMLAVVVAIACVMFAARRGLSWALSPIDMVNYVFHLAGSLTFRLTGSEHLCVLGGPLMQVAMPLAAAAHFWATPQTLSRRIAIFWLGQALFSLGSPLLMGFSQPGSYGEVIRSEMAAVLNMVGLATHAYRSGQLLIFSGCLLMAFAIVPAIWSRLE